MLQIIAVEKGKEGVYLIKGIKGLLLDGPKKLEIFMLGRIGRNITEEY